MKFARTRLLMISILLAPTPAWAGEGALEARAELRYREADRLMARDRAGEAAAAYLEAGQLFLEAADSPRISLPLARLHRRAFSALRRAANHLPEARARLAGLCAQLSADTAGQVALPSACNLPPEAPAPEAAPAPLFVTRPAEPAPAPPAPPTFPVSVSVGPRQAVRAGVDVRWDEETVAGRIGGSGRWRLPAGPHVIRMSAPGFEASTTAVTVGPDAKPVTVRLRRTPATRLRIGLAVALAGLGGGLVAGGAARVAYGRRMLDVAEGMIGEARVQAEVDEYFTYAARKRGQQFAALGAGGGTLLAIPAVATGNAKIAAVGAALGGLAVGVGAGLLVYARGEATRMLADPGYATHDAAMYAAHREGQVAAATVLGAGAGLLSGSLVALVAARRERRPLEVRPQVGVDRWGLGVAGAF